METYGSVEKGNLVFVAPLQLTVDSGKWTVMVSLRDDSKHPNPTVGEPFLAPGGETFRYSERFGENAPRTREPRMAPLQ